MPDLDDEADGTDQERQRSRQQHDAAPGALPSLKERMVPGGSVMRGGPALLSSSANNLASGKDRERLPRRWVALPYPTLVLCALHLTATYIHTYMAALREKGDRDKERSERRSSSRHRDRDRERDRCGVEPQLLLLPPVPAQP